MNSHDVSQSNFILTQWLLYAEQALELKVVVALEVSSEHEIQQNFFLACLQPALEFHNQHQ